MSWYYPNRLHRASTAPTRTLKPDDRIALSKAYISRGPYSSPDRTLPRNTVQAVTWVPRIAGKVMKHHSILQGKRWTPKTVCRRMCRQSLRVPTHVPVTITGIAAAIVEIDLLVVAHEVPRLPAPHRPPIGRSFNVEVVAKPTGYHIKYQLDISSSRLLPLNGHCQSFWNDANRFLVVNVAVPTNTLSVYIYQWAIIRICQNIYSRITVKPDHSLPHQIEGEQRLLSMTKQRYLQRNIYGYIRAHK